MTAEPSPHKSKNLNLEVVRDDSQPVKRGRPVRLTPRLFLRICHAVEKGSAITHACESELVTYSHFRFRVARNPRWQKRLKEAEATRESFLKEYHIDNIKKHAPRNVLASLWWLERRHPAEFALRNFHRPDPSAEQPVGDAIPIERLEQYGRLMLELAKENAAKELAQQGNNQLESERG
jgi:hypothetical protein